MAYNRQLSDRIREALVEQAEVEEKEMFGGVCYMVNGKMCVGVMKDEMMCRIDPEIISTILEKEDCRLMTMGGKTMKGYVLVGMDAIVSKKAFDHWIRLCLEFNPKAKASPSKKK